MERTPGSGLVDFARNIYLTMLPHLVANGTQLGSWVIVGNGVALLAAFNAILAGTNCNPHDLVRALWLFGVGLGLGFVGALISFFVNVKAAEQLGSAANHLGLAEVNELNLAEIEREYGPQPQDNPLQRGIDKAMEDASALQRKLPELKIGAVIAYFFYACAIVLFAAGTMAPAMNAAAVQTCAGN